MATEPFLINPPKRAPKRALMRKLSAKFLKRRKRQSNPFGEEFMFVGVNPVKKRKRGVSMLNPFRVKRRRKKASRRRKSNPMLKSLFGRAPKRRVRKSRRYRRNPAILQTAQQYLPSIQTVAGGLGGLIAVRALPRLLGVSGIPYYGVQIAAIVGGGYALHKAGTKEGAAGYIASSAALAIYDALKGLGLFGNLFSFLGINDEYLSAYPQLEAYPEDIAQSYQGIQGMGEYETDYHSSL